MQVMAVEAEKDEIFSSDEFASEDKNLTISERTAKLLKVTADEIERAKKEREKRKDVPVSLSATDRGGELHVKKKTCN